MFSHTKASLGRADAVRLGLALTKGLVELHDRDVETTRPEPGTGAESVVRPPAPAQPAAFPEVDGAVAPRLRLKPIRILVADDNYDAAASLAATLSLSTASGSYRFEPIV